MDVAVSARRKEALASVAGELRGLGVRAAAVSAGLADLIAAGGSFMTGRTNAVPDSGQDRPRLRDAPGLTSDLARRYEGGAGVMAGAPGTGRGGGAAGRVPVLMSDPRVSAVSVRDVGEPLIGLDESFGPSRARVRVSVARQLVRAREQLPQGLGLRVVEGYRTAAAQRAIIESYTAQLRAACRGVSLADLDHLTSRFVAPLAVAPHVAGAAVDVTLVDSAGCELDLGTPVDATPEQSDGACFFDAPQVTGQARAHRELLARVLGGAGLVNYPTEWWHWSYGDRYWALMTGAPAALYGLVAAGRILA